MAGTANTHQLPFSLPPTTASSAKAVAAGAYLSQEPMQVAGIKVQDWGKLVAAVLIPIGTITTTCKWPVIIDFFRYAS